MAYFNADCNEFLKTRKGLRSLIESYGRHASFLPDYTVEHAVQQEHLMWGFPLYD